MADCEKHLPNSKNPQRSMKGHFYCLILHNKSKNISCNFRMSYICGLNIVWQLCSSQISNCGVTVLNQRVLECIKPLTQVKYIYVYFCSLFKIDLGLLLWHYTWAVNFVMNTLLMHCTIALTDPGGQDSCPHCLRTYARKMSP